MSVTIARHSRLNFADLIEQDGTAFWDLPDDVSLPAQPDDIQYTALSTDRIDRLSARFYGDSALWWVIAVANNIEIHPTDLYEGQILRIPSPRYVLQELFKR